MVKLKDIAKKSGFSITTVSRALAGYDDVNVETRQQIREIAYGMGYQPNNIARQLRSQKTDTIGLIIPAGGESFSDNFFSELLMGAGQAAAQLGYDLLVGAQTSADPVDAYRRIVGGNRVDGVLLARTVRNDPRIAYLKSINAPFVVAGRTAPDETSDFPYIDVDSQMGIRWAINHLTGLGHRNIAFLLPPENIAFTAYRLAGYQEGLADAGLPFRPELTLHGDLRRDSGRELAHQLLDQFPEITALASSNDLMALGAMLAIQERGLSVGRDVAVTGFDGIAAAEYAQPALTTLRQPTQETGRHLVKMLIRIIQNEALEEFQTLLSPVLQIRESCGANRVRGGDAGQVE